MGIPGVQAPSRLGRYELLARLAAGGMGEIFLARLEGVAGFEKLFVIKRILPHLADDPRFRQMLIAEARLASRLSHANICQVYELGETDGQLYIVMEYLDGTTLLPLLRKTSKEAGALQFGFVAGVIQQATDALHYAHELKDNNGENLGIVHRDVTPSNLFLTDAGVAKILDFGIAKVKDASSNTQTGTVKGKYAYMSPEQLRGGQLDRRADVFALGVVIFEMLALRRLFQRKTDYLTFRAVMEQPIPDVRRYRPDVPDALATVLSTALERDPAKRYQTARQLGTAILDATGQLGRPWSQGEISDFLRHEYAAEIVKRTQAVHTAIARAASSAGRATMPLIPQDDEPSTEVDDADDDEFPSVDSTVTEAPAAFRATRPPTDGQEFSGQTGQVTPPPFSSDTSSTSGVAIQPLPRILPAPPEPVRPSRSLVWPVLAVAMVGIAAGALFLVWKQMQQQQVPAVVNITSSPAEPAPAPVDTVVPADAAVGVVPVSPDARLAKPVKDLHVPPSTSSNAYTSVLQSHRAAMTKCARDHGAPPAGAKVTINVSPDGRVKAISLEPSSLQSAPLGTCIKGVLSPAVFPKDKDEKKISVTIKAS